MVSFEEEHLIHWAVVQGEGVGGESPLKSLYHLNLLLEKKNNELEGMIEGNGITNTGL